MTTRKKLLAEFERMEAERNSILELLSQHPNEILDKKPSANAWSITEVIMHLVVAETGATKYMDKKLEFGGHSKASLGAGIKQKLLNAAISLPISYKAPKVAQIKEGDDVSYPEAKRQWDHIRSEMRNRYETVNESDIDNELFKHPAAGKLSLMQGLSFMRKHMNRHIEQMRRTLKTVS